MVAQGNLVTGLLAGLFLVLINPAFAIDVKLTTEEAQKALEAGRAPMEKANSMLRWRPASAPIPKRMRAGRARF